ncbi:amidohydrolase family protein [Flagellimonas olearia]|uniref:Amidohydrolase family protein n=1 Tax=Flagellimonas olearia TaxID=552546 RepID=A0A6I1DY36_9FLAO|nr:amidohydrolase family protein [Allomuricauda olearia]KAB7530363.1 amidohydrolase family protein [Allomuricauda olearia]
MKNLVFVFLPLLTFYVGHTQDKVFDTHVHIWDGEKSVREYLTQLDTTDLTVTKFGGIYMAKKGQMEETRLKNNELITLSKKYPQLLPICSVHPMDGTEAIAELERIVKLGVNSIKLHPHKNSMDFDVTDERVHSLCKKAGELGVTVLMDNASIVPGDCQKLFDLALRCPKTNFIFTHMGGLNFRFWNTLALARTAEGLLGNNIYFDISATVTLIVNSPLEEEFIWTMRNVGMDNILLGSDFPQFNLKQAIDAVEQLDLTQEEKQKIRFGNAKKLLFPD